MKEMLQQSRHSLEWLKFNQRQLDADGVEVAVSRQALDEVLIALETAIDVVPEMLAALITALPYVETAEGDAAYKPGAVARVTRLMRAAIAKAEGRADG